MTLPQYISSISSRYQLGNASEHTFRGDLQNLLEALVPSIRATNEPKRQSCGAPDYILAKIDASTGSASIPIGFVEAKDIGDNVPQVAWEFYIGGYQPAQKWLKDRKDRKLDFDDILHYQKIIVALTETERLMRAVDEIGIE